MKGNPIKHGDARRAGFSKEYIAWRNMIARCERPSSWRYAAYGAKGIKVCKRWRESFAAFLADLGRAPSKDHWLERKDPRKGYTPSNCCWEHKSQQMRNMRHTKYVTIRGERVKFIEAVEASGLPYDRVKRRIQRGWSAERALEVAV